MNKPIKLFIVSISILLIGACQNQKTVQLFDGQTLDGWDGSHTVFRVENGAIVGGSLTNPLDESYYLCTTEKYSDFILTLSVKFIDKDTIGNAGVSFRAERVPGTNEVASYQADLGYTTPEIVPHYSDYTYTPTDMSKPFSLWGTLVDECRADVSRYPKPEWFPVVFLEIPERELIQKIVKPHDWNELQIIAQGAEIEIKINGITTVTFTETTDVPKEGYICLQTHSGEPYEIHYKDIRIEVIK